MDERVMDARLHGELVEAWIQERLAEAELASLAAEVRRADRGPRTAGQGPSGGARSIGVIGPIGLIRSIGSGWRRPRAGAGFGFRRRSADVAG